MPIGDGADRWFPYPGGVQRRSDFRLDGPLEGDRGFRQQVVRLLPIRARCAAIRLCDLEQLGIPTYG